MARIDEINRRREMRRQAPAPLSPQPQGGTPSRQAGSVLDDPQPITYGNSGIVPTVTSGGAYRQGALRTMTEDEFNRNAPSIVAYGEFQSGTDVSGTERNGYKLVEFPLEYYRTNVTPKYLIIVCSSSKYGNLFTGGEGSTLYLDEMELIYE